MQKRFAMDYPTSFSKTFEPRSLAWCELHTSRNKLIEVSKGLNLLSDASMKDVLAGLPETISQRGSGTPSTDNTRYKGYGMKYPLTKFAQKCSDGWIDRCPAHDDNNPSLSIKETADGKLLLHCFAGCSFEDIVKAADIATHSQNCSNTYKPAYDETTAALKLSKRISKAESIWKETIPLDGTLAQTYLNSRDIEYLE